MVAVLWAPVYSNIIKLLRILSRWQPLRKTVKSKQYFQWASLQTIVQLADKFWLEFLCIDIPRIIRQVSIYWAYSYYKRLYSFKKDRETAVIDNINVLCTLGIMYLPTYQGYWKSLKKYSHIYQLIWDNFADLIRNGWHIQYGQYPYRGGYKTTKNCE